MMLHSKRGVSSQSPGLDELKLRDEQDNCALPPLRKTYRFVGVIFATKSLKGL